MDELLAIGELAVRAGVATSALRFYEDEGVILSERTAGINAAKRSTIRRVSVIRAAQRVGVPLRDVAEALAALPAHRTPTTRDWKNMSRRWKYSTRMMAPLNWGRSPLPSRQQLGECRLRSAAMVAPNGTVSR